MKKMIECTKFKSHESGCLQGFADFYVEKWGLEINGCSLYMKDGKRWINFPSKEFTNQEGEKAYAPLVKFRERDQMDKFSDSAKVAIDKYCKENEGVHQEPGFTKTMLDEEIPF